MSTQSLQIAVKMPHSAATKARAAPPAVKSAALGTRHLVLAVAVVLAILAWYVREFEPYTSATNFAYWLGVVGPSTLLLLRRFARGFDEFPGGFHVDLAETARALGLGRGTGRNAPLQRSIDRACTFGLARRVAPAPAVGSLPVVEVRLHLPHLAPHQLARLPESVRRSHDAWSESVTHQ